MKNPSVAIIITTYNQIELLFKCLDSLKSKTGYKNYKVFIVDDSGKGKIGREISKRYKWVDVSTNKKNMGFSKSNNIGIKKAIKKINPNYFLLLNDDTEIIQKNWLNELVKVGESDEKIGILGCKIVYPDYTLQNIGGYLNKWEIKKELKNRLEVFDVDHVMGAFMFIKKEVIKKIGLLDEIYNPYLLEDTDYCLNAKRAGFRIVSVGNISIIHKKGKSIDSLKSRKSTLIRFKNDILFSFKNLKFPYNLFRAFVYLPLVALFKKKSDEASLNFKNFIFSKDFMINIFLYSLSFFYSIKEIMKNGNKNFKKS